MRTLRIITIALAALAIGAVITALSMSSHWQVEASEQINVPPAKIFPLINTLSQWPEWTVWNKSSHPNLIMTYEGQPAGKGAIQIWQEGNSKSRLEIVDSETDRLVAYRLKMGSALFLMHGEIRLKPTARGTQVSWKVYGDTGPNLIARLMMLVFKPMIKNDLVGGLSNLKAKLQMPST